MMLEIGVLDDARILFDVNNAAVPDVGAVDLQKAAWLVAHCEVPGLARLDGQVAGIVVILSDRCGYASDYYRWFTERYESFLYVDRVVVAAWARGRGVARQMYAAVEQAALERNLAIVADVYSEPPNVPSLNFHRGSGFEEVGSVYMPKVQKTVAKLMKYPERAHRREQA
jgi:predicted GNAT superfamily acetyltransferase